MMHLVHSAPVAQCIANSCRLFFDSKHTIHEYIIDCCELQAYQVPRCLDMPALDQHRSDTKNTSNSAKIRPSPAFAQALLAPFDCLVASMDN